MRHGKIVFCLLILGISACSPIETPTFIAQTPIPATVEATATAEPTPAQVTQASPVEWVGAVVFYSNMEGNPDIYFMSTSSTPRASKNARMSASNCARRRRVSRLAAGRQPMSIVKSKKSIPALFRLDASRYRPATISEDPALAAPDLRAGHPWPGATGHP